MQPRKPSRLSSKPYSSEETISLFLDQMQQSEGEYKPILDSCHEKNSIMVLHILNAIQEGLLNSIDSDFHKKAEQALEKIEEYYDNEKKHIDYNHLKPTFQANVKTALGKAQAQLAAGDINDALMARAIFELSELNQPIDAKNENINKLISFYSEPSRMRVMMDVLIKSYNAMPELKAQIEQAYKNIQTLCKNLNIEASLKQAFRDDPYFALQLDQILKGSKPGGLLDVHTAYVVKMEALRKTEPSYYPSQKFGK